MPAEVGDRGLYETLTQNERRVLDLIWRKGPIARAELSDKLGLTTGSLSRITQNFVSSGIVLESIRHDGVRGNPMRPLQINPEGAMAFGVSFSHTYMEVGLINLAGELVDSVRQNYAEARPEVIAASARDAISLLEETNSVDPDRVLGVGFAVPGDFSPEHPFLIAHPYFPHLRDANLHAIFSESMPYPVFIENDCNSAALGERVVGFGKQYTNFISVFVCHGIGGGVILDSDLYRGVHGNAGGIHAFFPMHQARPSGHDFFDVMAREGHPIRDFNDLEVTGALELSGVRPWLSRAGAQLLEALSVVARLFDPEAIIIGGRLPPSFLDEIRAAVDTKSFCASSAAAKPAVHASGLGPKAGVVGAGALVIYARFLDSRSATRSDNLINGRRQS
ncbi:MULTISPECIES: ROK family transcriptional regulator [unclassified Novosphingobium]|uniref:ROK family transcriptional regulator n=1 Tax=unclassified Novosphingobium TaxID=2644732 RepID=UPI0025CE18E3|nr:MULTISPECIES: ROK family transcriptional regulator [unclassified Novosphingobium]HQS69202.1 ROK family transcriptional regulator [Novosphingobium sp.]